MYKLMLLLLLSALFMLHAAADVIAGPMIALYVGIHFVIPIILVIIVIIVTIRLIRTIRGGRKEHEED